MRLVDGGDAKQEPEDAREAAVWRAIDVGHTLAAQTATRRLRAAALRALRDPDGMEEFRTLAAVAALHPWMLQEAEELIGECGALDQPRVFEALEAFLAVHRQPAVTLSS
jgi:hypothetical protein